MNKNIRKDQEYTFLFQQPVLKTSLGLNDGDEFDATKTGPVCSQGTIDADNLDQLFSQQVSDIIAEAIDSVISKSGIIKKPDYEHFFLLSD